MKVSGRFYNKPALLFFSAQGAAAVFIITSSVDFDRTSVAKPLMRTIVKEVLGAPGAWCVEDA